MAAIRTLGTMLLGVPYDPGTPATTTVALTMIDEAGYTIPGGVSQIAIDGYAFVLTADAVVPAGSDSIGGVPVACLVDTAAANGLTGDNVSSLTLPSWVTGIVVEAATANGTDPEDDPTYAGKVSAELMTRARTLVNARDLALDALAVPGVARAYAVTSAARVVDVWLVGEDGLPVTSDVKTQVTSRYADARMINIVYNVHDASYCTVNVAYSVVANPNVIPADLTSRINDALVAILSSLSWGGGGSAVPTGVGLWSINQPVVFKNAIVAAIGAIYGVVLVESVTLSSPTAGATVSSAGDLTMPGVVPLPQLGTVTPTLDYPS
jgi:hypothetical protein